MRRTPLPGLTASPDEAAAFAVRHARAVLRHGDPGDADRGSPTFPPPLRESAPGNDEGQSGCTMTVGRRTERKRKARTARAGLQSEDGIPKGSRTPVFGMRTRCPRPLDDGDSRMGYKVECVDRKSNAEGRISRRGSHAVSGVSTRWMAASFFTCGRHLARAGSTARSPDPAELCCR